MLTDKHWSKLRPILLQLGIYDKIDLRTTVEDILYRMRNGCQWRDLPEAFGPWNTVYKRFNAWSAAGKLMAAFRALVDDPDVEWLFSYGAYVKAHQDSTGAATEEAEAVGKSRAGNTSKIHLAVDAYGLSNAFRITGGEVHDSTEAQALIDDLPTREALIADKGYDSERIREQVEAKGMRPVIPRKRNSKKGNYSLDRELYRYQHLVENAFARLKPYRAIAMWYDKLKRNYKSMVALACGFLWLPM
jgi:transposase